MISLSNYIFKIKWKRKEKGGVSHTMLRTFDKWEIPISPFFKF